mmetsp:Transcript_19163/g.76796  ORF Transcript_19163/g.76796 Transcript_19163/m.76796 type:complete len:92 (+) Transcript_19163:458-733(+)
MAFADETFYRFESRVERQILRPLEEDLNRARDVESRLEKRKRILLDYDRYQARLDSQSSREDTAKRDDTLSELTGITVHLDVGWGSPFFSG